LLAQIDWWRLAQRLAGDLADTKESPEGHASEICTSVIMACRSDLIDMTRAEKRAVKTGFFTKYPNLILYPDYGELSDQGGIGNPTHYPRRRKGRR